MLWEPLITMRDFLHAQFCYQLFITPLPLKMPKEYMDFTARARDYVLDKRTARIEFYSPRHHVIHRFNQKSDVSAKKVLIAHGWTSRAAYMVRTIRLLHEQGYDVYALDFPAHGEARGIQLPWFDAVHILKNVLNELGPFYAVIGHSFGGSMLLNTLSLASQLPEWQIKAVPERAILMASPTRMRTPISCMARRINLSAKAFAFFCENIRKNSSININLLNLHHFIHKGQTPVLCIHGQEDKIIDVKESVVFSRKYPHASLALIPDVDHIGVLIDKRVEHMVSNFLL